MKTIKEIKETYNYKYRYIDINDNYGYVYDMPNTIIQYFIDDKETYIKEISR